MQSSTSLVPSLHSKLFFACEKKLGVETGNESSPAPAAKTCYVFNEKLI